MSIKYADVREEYAKNKQLREEDVQALQQWVFKQPHLPAITELQLMLFLQSCYFSIEAAKTTVDNFFTVKNLCPEFFANRDATTSKFKDVANVGLYKMLPKTTPEQYRVLFCKIIDGDASNFNFNDQIKLFDMAIVLSLMQEGSAEGLMIVIDMANIAFGHLTKLSVMGMKKFLFYLQEALPVRVKGMHFINVVSFMDKILALMKPFMKKELMDVLYLHTESIDSLYKFVPQECLPKDYGGTSQCVSDLHVEMQKRLIDHVDFFKADEKQIVDESLRPGKPKNAGDLFGVEGTFKKLDID